MFYIVMPPRVRGRARGRPAGHVRGRAGTGGRGVEDSSSSSAPSDAFGGVPGGAQFFREMPEAMREFTQAARESWNEIPPPPPAAPVVQEPLPTVPLAPVEPRVLSVMREFE